MPAIPLKSLRCFLSYLDSARHFILTPAYLIETVLFLHALHGSMRFLFYTFFTRPGGLTGKSPALPGFTSSPIRPWGFLWMNWDLVLSCWLFLYLNLLPSISTGKTFDVLGIVKVLNNIFGLYNSFGPFSIIAYVLWKIIVWIFVFRFTNVFFT